MWESSIAQIFLKSICCCFCWKATFFNFQILESLRSIKFLQGFVIPALFSHVFSMEKKTGISKRPILWPNLNYMSFQTLGISLLWRSPSDSLKVSIKVGVTLLNREYFGENRSFKINKAVFDKDNASNGNLNFIKLGDLLTHRPRFTDHNGEFQVTLDGNSVECQRYALTHRSAGD